MRRTIILMIAIVALLLPVGVTAAQPARYIALEPAAATLDAVFTVTGTGFLPGEVAIHSFTSPDGTEFSPGPAAVHLADDQGIFQFQFVPILDFTTPVPGPWKLTVCLNDRRTCATLDFTIAN
ncbi:MAG: hypothetical protein U0556_06525 [Dehalococcoidia bacterium]